MSDKFVNRFVPAAAAATMVLSLGLAGANAADVVYETPAPVEPYVAPVETSDWSGVYGGATLGYGWGDTDLPGNSMSTDGFLGGVFGGAQMQSGQFVYGGEADIGYSWLDGANAGATTKAGVEGSLRARLGYAMNDRVLLYGTGGVALARHEVANAAGEDTQNMVGWTAGAGVDVKLTEALFGRAEYRYTDFGNKDFNLGGTINSVDVTQNRVMVGLGVQF